ncbi:hypothetical protein LDG_9098 [Legionella drancourtii LLAP12]|uniref:Uncharacterized protein n=1 Tax=Legionella drancourtii LLAP12 TaxID=658187 RepID=G9EUU8_9GAMM|nr:hypothetical protein LDG_9098 [Legionella drancourtii LLAP12]
MSDGVNGTTNCFNNVENLLVFKSIVTSHLLKKAQHIQSVNQTVFEQFYELAVNSPRINPFVA